MLIFSSLSSFIANHGQNAGITNKVNNVADVRPNTTTEDKRPFDF
jgi:hypothetical protein